MIEEAPGCFSEIEHCLALSFERWSHAELLSPEMPAALHNTIAIPIRYRPHAAKTNFFASSMDAPTIR
jgi:hypothetical protein